MMDEKERPLMAQYMAIKEQYKDAVLLFQVGGFYQMYYNDAQLAVELLNLKMISRPIGGGQRAPMCGVPKAAVEKHSRFFAEQGYRVVVCDQKQEDGCNIRAVSRIIEPSSPQIDLTEGWEQYLADFKPEQLPAESTKKKKVPKSESEEPQEKTNAEHLFDALRQTSLDDMTPLQALILLHEWKRKYLA